MEMLSPSNGYPGDRARRAACNRCRTQKLRCERPIHLPDKAGRTSHRPCIRCTRLGTVCVTSAPQRLGRPTLQRGQTNFQPPPSTVNSIVMDPQPPSSSASAPWDDVLDMSTYYGGTVTPLSTGQATTPDLTTIMSSSKGSTPELDINNHFEVAEQGLPPFPEQCIWKSAAGIAPRTAPLNMRESMPTPLMDDAADLSNFSLAGSSMDAIMGTVLHLSTDPFPTVRTQMSDSGKGYRQDMELPSALHSPKQLTYGTILSELLTLGAKFVDNVEAYEAAGGTEADIKRTILQTSIITSGKLLKIFKIISTDARSTTPTQEALPSNRQALLTQASSSYVLESRQWHVILGHILRQLKQSPQDADIIAEVIPSTRMEGMDFDNSLLQARFFLQACIHTAEELYKQMDSLFEVFSEPGSTPLDTRSILKGVKSLHAELLNVLERLHS